MDFYLREAMACIAKADGVLKDLILPGMASKLKDPYNTVANLHVKVMKLRKLTE